MDTRSYLAIKVFFFKINEEGLMRKHSKQIMWIASCLFITALFLPLLFAQEVKIETIEGVVVVHNPKKPVDLPGISGTLKLREDLRIGIEAGDENYMFSQLYSIQVSDGEKIIAYDGQEVSIKVYDKNGKFIRKFGQIGQGPGELQKPAQINITRENLITILDPRNRRFSYHSLEGECIKEIPTGKDRPLEAKADSSGNIYGYVLVLGKTSTLDLVKFNQQFKPIKTINSIEMPKTPPPGDLIELVRFHVLKDDYLIWGRSYRYEFNILDEETKLVRRIIKDYDPIRITKDNLIDEYKRRYPGKKLPPKMRKIPDHFPNHFPVFEDFLCGDEGRIFVRTFERDQEDNVFYDVFDVEGRYFTQFSLPFEEKVSAVKKNKMYCMIQGDKDGIPKIKRYEMMWE